MESKSVMLWLIAFLLLIFLYLLKCASFKNIVEPFSTVIVPPWNLSGGFGSKFTWVQRNVLDTPMKAISRDELPLDIRNDLSNANRFVNVQINFKKTDVPTYVKVETTGENDAYAENALTLRNTKTKVTPEYLATLSSRVREWVAQYVEDQQNAITEKKELEISRAVSGNAGKQAAEKAFTASQRARGDAQRKRYADDLKKAMSQSVLTQAAAVAAVDSMDKIVSDTKAKDATAGAALEPFLPNARKMVEDAILAGKSIEDAIRDGATYLKGQLPKTITISTIASLDQAKEIAVSSAFDTAKDTLKNAIDKKSIQSTRIIKDMSKFAKIAPVTAFSTALTSVTNQLVGAVAKAIADSEDAKCPAGFSPGGSIAENNSEYAITSQVLGSVMPLPIFDFINSGLTAVSCIRTTPDGKVEMATRTRCMPNLVGNKYYCYGPRAELMKEGQQIPYLQISKDLFLPDCIKPFTVEGLCDSAAQFLFEMTWDFASKRDNVFMVITRFTRVIRISDTLMDAEFQFKYLDKTSRIEVNLPPDGRTSQCTFVFTPEGFAAARNLLSLVTNTNITIPQNKILTDLALKGECEGRTAKWLCDNGYISGYYKTIGMVYQAPFITTGASIYNGNAIQLNFEPQIDFSKRYDVSVPVLGIEYASFAPNLNTIPPYSDWNLLDELNKRKSNNSLILDIVTKSLPNTSGISNMSNTLVIRYNYGDEAKTIGVPVGSPLRIEPSSIVIPAKKLRAPYWDVSKLKKL